LLDELVSGVISSVLAVLLVELYLIVRRRLRHRSLRAVLNRPRRVTLVAPIFPHAAGLNTISLMGTHDAYAIAHILDAYRRLGGEPSVASAGRLSDGLDGDLVCIGGSTSTN
jgi:hypothetical protein